MRSSAIVCLFALAGILSACTHSSNSGCSPNARVNVSFEQLYKQADGAKNAGYTLYEKNSDTSIKTRAAEGNIVWLATNETVYTYGESDLLGSGDLFGDLPSFEIDEATGKLLATHVSGPDHDQDKLSPSHQAESMLFGTDSLAMDDLTGETNPKTYEAFKNSFENGAHGQARVCNESVNELILQSPSMSDYRSARANIIFNVSVKK